VLLLLVSALAASVGVPALAQEGGAPQRVRYLSVHAEETSCSGGEAPCWDLGTLVANAGDVVNVTVDLQGAAQPHDFSIKVGTQTVKTPTGVGGIHQVQFTFPENAKSLDYFCSVHPKTMTGKIVIPSQLGATTGETEVPHLGVNFLSYWVGVIAFMILFLVYGATFFLFKYNETPATTDQWDRPDMEGGRRFSPGAASLLALVIAAVLVGAVVWLARS
jgi:plastocyanin